MRSTLTRQLASLGVNEVAVAADGREAGERYARKQPPYDVIISDLQMPGGDGLQLLRRLSGGDPGPAVILISGLDARLLRTAEEIAHQRGIWLDAWLQIQRLQRVARPDHPRRHAHQIRQAGEGVPIEISRRTSRVNTTNHLDSGIRRKFEENYRRRTGERT